MEETETNTLIFLMWQDKWVRTSVFLLFVLFLTLTLTLSLLSGAVVVVAYVAGFLVFNVKRPVISEIPLGIGGSAGPKGSSCSVCGGDQCRRHKPSSQLQQPWAGLDIPQEVDEAIEDLLNETLGQFVYSWYGTLSLDNSFVLELRQSFRYAASSLLYKGLQIDLAELIVDKLVPAGLRHLDDILVSIRLATKQGAEQATSKHETNQDLDPQSPAECFKQGGGQLEAAMAEHLGQRLHPAVTSRDAELRYLRSLAAALLPKLLPPSQAQCLSGAALVRELVAGWLLLPLADTLSDPAILNGLLARASSLNVPEPTGRIVGFLAKFVSPPPPRLPSALQVEMSGVLKDQPLLYALMQFLKAEGRVPVLQFCLDVEAFNRRLLDPEIGDLEPLHREAWDLYSVYFKADSPDRLSFDAEIVEGMHRIVSGSAGDVVKLRTSRALFAAYEAAFGELESQLLPRFQHSTAFYTLLCGPSHNESGGAKSGNSSPVQQGSPAKGRGAKRWEGAGAVARISSRLHKIKGALRAQPIEGSAYDSDVALEETEFAEDVPLEESLHRDLSAWRVSIPLVQNRTEPGGRSGLVFSVQVRRIDAAAQDELELSQWCVERRFNDFYALEAKLIEFHGEFADAALPAKRMIFESRTLEAMHSKRQALETYLQSLLQKPSLRRSDLLHAFLRPGTQWEAGAGEGIGRLIRRTVPIRLRKERGQHLEPFLATLLQSTETPRKSTRFEHRDVSLSGRVERPRNISNSVFRDNFSLGSPRAGHCARGVTVAGAFDCVLFLAVRAFGISQTLVRLALAVRSVCRDALDALAKFWLGRKLRRLLSPPRLAVLVNLLRGAIFHSQRSNSESDRLQRAQAAQARLHTLTPRWLALVLGQRYRLGLDSMFHALQNPVLNKQLCYTLLDIVATELYPELDNGIASPQTTDK